MQPLQYKRYEKLKVAKLKLNPELQMDLVFFNPNGVGCALENIDVKIVSESNDTVAYVILQNEIKLPANTEFKVPIACNISTGRLLKNSLQEMINGEDIQVTYVGNFTVRKFIFKKEYSFVSKEKFNRKMFLGF
ncbi:MAG: hypothetical protein IPO27_12615 [Bacteroidetes bacterium]|nr:hypothetical protein [Bacteroidota bacterium]